MLTEGPPDRRDHPYVLKTPMVANLQKSRAHSSRQCRTYLEVAIQPELGFHCGRARLPAGVGCARRRVRVVGAAVRRGAMGARLRAGARDCR